VKQFGGAAKFIDLARDVNAGMPLYVVHRVQDLLNDRERSLRGARILLLGVAYTPDIEDLRESPALPLIDLLQKKGARVSFSDPFVPELTVGDLTLQSTTLSAAALAAADCVIVITPHRGVDYALVTEHAGLVFDTRNALPASPNVHRL
jgi:UDP-N-acetyl-D-glucosamine dehydrogenase